MSHAATVAYLGFHEKDNLGDDAIYDAVKSQLPGVTFNDIPRLPHEFVLPPAAAWERARRPSTLVMGGGTLVGVRYFRQLVKLGLAVTKNNGKYAIGVGVQDPGYVGRGSGSARGELTKWASILAGFDSVSVRGPRSVELLADIGLAAKVTGDPALILPRPEVPVEDGLIGVNLGYGDDLWGHDPAGVADQIAIAVKELSRRGHRFVGILMNPGDRRWLEVAFRDVGADILLPADATAAAREFARCSAAIVCRLHAGILAALSDTPVVSLEYQPKCRDFALSIDDERSLIRTDQVTGAGVVDRALGALADAGTIRAAKRAAVDRLRTQLHTEYSALRRQLGVAAD
ncbi:polysaccharide pyruvyl transferase family protein [Mycobacterium sp. CVI_P3]|uniref:Polysaccharide pyruvyl transferase family protein n=1 Tax=Mycobacterium pinniadriaticum TaxID=2994102 RepID=A0ABT3SCA0_9MYCO|nr:polysaccharide pyruvyl transferase family protein [Mycobacterium pinniadriaticum]MCX2930190.1 polysaccharide pyruvyl transferase family protein [Mycobacterium pinniadriaticum]MCX2936748.1 polysaccharide pyruvyl transferase family protein [Mycobacterium pinniadriaticum]